MCPTASCTCSTSHRVTTHTPPPPCHRPPHTHTHVHTLCTNTSTHTHSHHTHPHRLPSHLPARASPLRGDRCAHSRGTATQMHHTSRTGPRPAQGPTCGGHTRIVQPAQSQCVCVCAPGWGGVHKGRHVLTYVMCLGRHGDDWDRHCSAWLALQVSGMGTSHCWS